MPDRVFTVEEKERLRGIMLEAGFPLIKEYGITHTTVEKIADAADIAKGTFYHFWKNKEEYIADLILYHQNKIIPKIIDEDVLKGERTLGREDARAYLRIMVDKEKSIYPHMTLADEVRIMSKTTNFAPDERKESQVTAGLLGYLRNVRPDADLLLLANMTKVLVLTAQARVELHESVYEKTIDTLIDCILDHIFLETN
jgi:AcrR family transcriptional regulator